MAQHHDEALRRLDHELLEGRRLAAGLQEEHAQAQQLAARLVLALAAQRRRVERQVGEQVRSREQPVLAPDVVQLHGEGVARAAQVLVVHHDGQREAALAPAGDERCQALEDRERHARHDQRRVDVRATRDPPVAGGAAGVATATGTGAPAAGGPAGGPALVGLAGARGARGLAAAAEALLRRGDAVVVLGRLRTTPGPLGIAAAGAALAARAASAAILPPPARTTALLLAPLLGAWAVVVECYGGVPTHASGTAAALVVRARRAPRRRAHRGPPSAPRTVASPSRRAARGPCEG